MKGNKRSQIFSGVRRPGKIIRLAKKQGKERRWRRRWRTLMIWIREKKWKEKWRSDGDGKERKEKKKAVD